MTDVPQTTQLITLAQEFRGDIVAQINRRVTALKMLPIVRGAGKNVAFVAQGSGHVAENYSEGADAANYGSDVQVPATLNWGLYRAPIHVTQLAMDTAATSSSPQGNIELWVKNIKDSASALADLIEDELFDGLGTGSLIAGLDVAIGSTSNTYAAINRATSGNEFFHPMVVDPGVATAPTLALIRRDLGVIFDASGETPDLAFCSTAVFNRVAGLFDANRRWTNVNTARGSIKLDAGYEGIEVDGCMFVKASKATANQIYYVNSRHVEIQVLPSSTVPQELRRDINPDDGYGDIPLDMTFEMLAKTGPASKGETLATCQLVVNRPNACGIRFNVAA